MGAGASALFAARGYEVVMMARTREKAEKGLIAATKAVRANAIANHIRLASYDELEAEVAQADLVLEAVAERLDLKQTFFERIDKARRNGTIVATVSSGLSIDAMAKGRSDDFRRHFMGAHLFNPPNVIVGTEAIPGRDTDPDVFASVVETLEKRLGRVVIECRDQPAFAGNRIGFELLNECAQLAREHGVQKVDYLIGSHTGRAMPPLMTIDLVGWDVHRAIVDNVYANTSDEAHDAFELPAYMSELIERGHLGNKTAEAGGFYRRLRTLDGQKVTFVLDPESATYVDKQPKQDIVVPYVEEMKALHRVGRYEEAMRLFLTADGSDAELARRVILGYVSYGLNRVGETEVVSRPLDVDLIMGWGFNWAPPSVLVDVFGRERTIEAMSKLGLKVPQVLIDLEPGEKLFDHPQTNIGRYFVAR